MGGGLATTSALHHLTPSPAANQLLPPAAPPPPPLPLSLSLPQGGRTVPRIFVDGVFIGGADDVSAKDASGDLAALLKGKGLVA